MTFFTKKKTHASVLQTIANAKQLLAHIPEDDKYAFLTLLAQRTEDFENALKNITDPNEKQRILEQYARFAKTVVSCLSQPRYTNSYTSSYFNSRDYYAVGITERVKEPIRHNVSLGATILGAILVLASIIAFPYMPILSAILFPIGLTMLAPGVISLMTPSPLDPIAKQQEEKMIFQAGAKLIDPAVSFDEFPRNEGAFPLVAM